MRNIYFINEENDKIIKFFSFIKIKYFNFNVYFDGIVNIFHV